MTVAGTDIEVFKDSARDFLSRGGGQGARIRARVIEGAPFDRAFWSATAEAGWPAILVPEAQGGLDLGLDAMAAVAEEVGRAYIGDPVVPVAVLSATLLSRLPAGALRDELLEGLAAGELVVGTAWQQRLGQLEPAPQANAVLAAGQWRIQASYLSVTPARGADGWMVLAADDQAQPLLAWVPASTQGVSAQDEARVDGANGGTLVLDACVLPEAQVLARGEVVLSALSEALETARLVQAAQLLGVASQAFDTTLAYMGVRVQFGKPIGSFQSLQHRMVDGYMQIQLLSHALTQALERVAQDRSALALEASRLQSRAQQAAGLVTRLAVQIHGGIGYSDESDIGLALKRTLGLSAELGNARAHQRRYARLVTASLQQAPVEQAQDRDWPAFPRDADWDAMPEAEFRSMLRAFFRKHYPDALRHCSGRLHWAQIKDWYRTLSAQGWIAPAWPKEHGGMALPADKMIAYIEEQERYGVGRPPDQGIVMLGPILIRYGTPAQQARYLPPILSGEHVWAQGYSEPNAGSDLASLRCEAVLEGEHFIVNGQKTWSTLAQDATHMFMLVRTDKTVKKQAGISFLLVDLASPGVQVRPIRTIAGDEEYCEIFFDDVKVPRENLVGELNQGWTISKTLLGYERLFSGSPKHSRNTLAMVERIARQEGLFEDPGFAADYAQCHLDLEDLSAAYAAYSDIVKRKAPLPASVSLLKLWATETHERISLLLLDAARDDAAVSGPLPLRGPAAHEAGTVSDVQMPLFNAAAAKIFSGTNEIQRNILAKLVLNLPA